MKLETYEKMYNHNRYNNTDAAVSIIISNDVKNILKQIERCKKKRSILNGEINKLEQTLIEICNHSNQTIKREYIEGGYLDRSEYITKVKCEVCGEILDTKTEYGNYC
jgi:hypothetical protein